MMWVEPIKTQMYLSIRKHKSNVATLNAFQKTENNKRITLNIGHLPTKEVWASKTRNGIFRHTCFEQYLRKPIQWMVKNIKNFANHTFKSNHSITITFWLDNLQKQYFNLKRSIKILRKLNYLGPVPTPTKKKKKNWLIIIMMRIRPSAKQLDIPKMS